MMKNSAVIIISIMFCYILYDAKTDKQDKATLSDLNNSLHLVDVYTFIKRRGLKFILM